MNVCLFVQYTVKLVNMYTVIDSSSSIQVGSLFLEFMI